MKRFGKIGAVLALTLSMMMVGACSSSSGDGGTAGENNGESGTKPAKSITLGFSQVGAESGWRSANKALRISP